MGQARNPVNWVEPRRVIYDHELVLFANGEYEVTVESERYACPEGSFLIVPPGRMHVSRLASRHPGRRCWVHFDWAYAGDSARLPVLTYAPAAPAEEQFRPAPPYVPETLLHGPIPTPAEVFDLHARLDRRWNHGTPGERAACRGLLLELLLNLLHPREAPAASIPAGHRLAARIREALAALGEQESGSRPGIQHALRRLGYSYGHLCRIFRKEYGISPVGYVNAIRIERAKLLLRDTELTVSEIALRTGFDSLSYFSRRFRQITGQCPTAFREAAATEIGTRRSPP